MFKGCAYQLWADKEFPILKNLTDQPSQDSGRIDTGYNQALLETLHEALGTLPCKKSKIKAAKNTEKANATLEDLSVQKDEDPQHETTLQKDEIQNTKLHRQPALLLLQHHSPGNAGILWTLFRKEKCHDS